MAKKIGTCRCTFAGLRQDFITGDMEMVFKIHKDFKARAKKIADDSRNLDLNVSIEKYTEKRSLDANAYAWKLLEELAERLTAEGGAYSKDDMYLIMLKRYGQGGIAKIPNKDIEKFKRAWKYCEEHEILYDENAVYYRFWVGSSNYDTQEMSLFINGIVAECKEQGISTETPEQQARLLDEWAEKQAG